MTAILLVCSTPALSASWVCKVEETAGFRWNEESKSYSSTVFPAEDTFLVRPATELEIGTYKALELKYVMVKLGSDEPIAFWEDDIASWAEKRPAQSFPVAAYFTQFSPSKGELVHFVYYSLVSALEERDSDIWIDYARCSKLND